VTGLANITQINFYKKLESHLAPAMCCSI
jgi:hypothetical protein